MHYSASVKLKPGSQALRAFLRQNKFTIYRINLTGISADDDVDDPDSIPHHYVGYYNGDKPLPEAVKKRLDEEFAKELVLKYQTTQSHYLFLLFSKPSSASPAPGISFGALLWYNYPMPV